MIYLKTLIENLQAEAERLEKEGVPRGEQMAAIRVTTDVGGNPSMAALTVGEPYKLGTDHKRCLWVPDEKRHGAEIGFAHVELVEMPEFKARKKFGRGERKKYTVTPMRRSCPKCKEQYLFQALPSLTYTASCPEEAAWKAHDYMGSGGSYGSQGMQLAAFDKHDIVFRVKERGSEKGKGLTWVEQKYFINKRPVRTDFVELGGTGEVEETDANW